MINTAIVPKYTVYGKLTEELIVLDDQLPWAPGPYWSYTKTSSGSVRVYAPGNAYSGVSLEGERDPKQLPLLLAKKNSRIEELLLCTVVCDGLYLIVGGSDTNELYELFYRNVITALTPNDVRAILLQQGIAIKDLKGVYYVIPLQVTPLRERSDYQEITGLVKESLKSLGYQKKAQYSLTAIHQLVWANRFKNVRGQMDFYGSYLQSIATKTLETLAEALGLEIKSLLAEHQRIANDLLLELPEVVWEVVPEDWE